MKESEWKKFKKLKEKCLERFCAEVLDTARGICESDKKTNHERYIELYQLMKNRDKELENAFDRHSRSAAHSQLLFMYRMGLVEEAELNEFETETVRHIQGNNKDLEFINSYNKCLHWTSASCARSGQ